MSEYDNYVQSCSFDHIHLRAKKQCKKNGSFNKTVLIKSDPTEDNIVDFSVVHATCLDQCLYNDMLYSGHVWLTCYKI